MIATNELRFVEREIVVTTDWDVLGTPITGLKKTVRVLQQKWKVRPVYKEGADYTDFEWRDVPCVKEEA